jgi:hypothetical protein
MGPEGRRSEVEKKSISVGRILRKLVMMREYYSLKYVEYAVGTMITDSKN